MVLGVKGTMTINFDKNNIFGDFLDEPDSMAVWADFAHLFKVVLPDIGITPETFDTYFDKMTDQTNKFLVMLFVESGDPVIRSYGKTFIEDIEDEYEDGLKGFFAESHKERILGGHAYFIKSALFDVLQTVCFEYRDAPSADKIKPDKDFLARFRPHAEKFMPHVAGLTGFPSSHLAAMYASMIEIDADYKVWQEEGLEDFAELYAQNMDLISAIEYRYASTLLSKKLPSFAQDFNQADENRRCKMEYITVLLNLLSQAFDIDIPKIAIRDLGSTLASAIHDEYLIAFDEGYIKKAGLQHLFETVAHEFCHFLQKEEYLNFRMDYYPDKFAELDGWDKMVFFFNYVMYRNPGEDDVDHTLYDENVKERDANAFAERAYEIMNRRTLHYSLDMALGL